MLLTGRDERVAFSPSLLRFDNIDRKRARSTENHIIMCNRMHNDLMESVVAKNIAGADIKRVLAT